MYIYDNILLNYSSNEKKSDKIRRLDQNIRFMFNNFCPESVPLSDIVEKVRTARHATDYNRAHARCVLDT